MSSVLTTNILPVLVKYLNGCEVVKIRRVCKIWKNFVDNSEETWKELCLREFGEVEEAKRKSGLGWREFYKSLSLWSNIENATMDYYESPYLEHERPCDSERKRKFTILKNNLIAYPSYIGESYSDYFFYYNTIIYYDAENLSEHHHETFDFLFDYYVESDDLYVFRTHTEKETNVLVMLKANKKKIIMEKTKQYIYGDYSKVFLLKNNVYFKTEDSTICVAKLKEENGELTLETTRLDQLTVGMMAMTMVDENHVNILTYRGHIFSLKDNKIKCVHKIDKEDSTREIIRELKEHAFDWSSPEVYKWLSRLHNIQITKLKHAILCKEGKCFIIGTCVQKLHIYWNPYKLGELVLYITPKPILKVDLIELFPYLDEQRRHSSDTKIKQIEVIEMVNGHKIVVLYCNKLVIVEFTHNYNSGKRTSTQAEVQNDSDVSKRARSDTCLQASTSSATV